MPNEREFEEIGHCGGQITFNVQTHEGRRQYSVQIEHSAPTAAAWIGLYALPQGIPVLGFAMGGMMVPWDPQPPTPDSIAVFIASDRETMFGRQCRVCDSYWRSRSASAKWPTVCPYCGHKDGMHAFTTDAQVRYIEHYTKTLLEAIHGEEEETEVVIDMDQYADRTNREIERPACYYAEESQQSQWTCSRCDNTDDILGHYGYCSSSGYRNNLGLVQQKLAAIRDRCTTGDAHEFLKDIVSHFEGFGRDLVEQLAGRIAMTPARRNAVRGLRFHNISRTRDVLRAVFDIDMFQGINEERQRFAHVKFLRRNLYEHRAGVVDQEYLDASGDDVRLGQRLSEHVGDVRLLIDIAEYMAANLDHGFHAIFPSREV